MNQANPPPIDLEKYLAGKKHRYCTYQNGARLYSMAYWPFVVMCKEAGANISLRKTALVDLDVLDKYIEENCNEDYESEDMDMTRRRKIENLEEIVKEAKKMDKEFTLADIPTFSDVGEAIVEYKIKESPAQVRARLGKMFNEAVRQGTAKGVERATTVKDGEEQLNLDIYKDTLDRAAEFGKDHETSLWCYGNHDGCTGQSC